METRDATQSHYRVLYVNDDEAFCELVRTKSERLAVDVDLTFAASRTEALACLDSSDVDCVVTAYSLETETGLDLTEAIRERHPNLPIVLFTGQGSETIASRATRADVTDYIPIRSNRNNFELLGNRIQTLVAAERKRRLGRRSAERFRRTLERTTDAVYAVDSEWRIEYMNDRMAARVDRDAEAVVGNRLWDEFPSIADTELAALYREAMATGDPVETEQYLGEPYEYMVEVRAFPEEDGLTVFSREVTEEHRRRQELQQAEAILENLDDPVLVLDADREIQFANAYAQETLSDGTIDDPVGESLFEVVSKASDDALRTQFLESFEEVLESAGVDEDGTAEGPRDYRTTIQSRDDGWTFDVTLSPLETSEGRRVIVLARDVSEQANRRRQMRQERDALRTVQSTIASNTLDHDERVSEVIEAGRTALDADVGVLSRSDDEVTVAATDPQRGDAVSESLLKAEPTQFAVDAPRDTVVTSLADGGDPPHAQEAVSDVESYVACPIFVDGELYGRLEFASEGPSPSGFTDYQTTLASLLAQWVSRELDRERSREHVEASRERTRQIIDMLPQLVFAKDEAGNFLLANEALAEAYGTTVSELEGMTDADFADSATEVEAFREDDRAVIESGDPEHIEEEPLTTAAGERRLFQTTKIPYEPVRSDDRAILGVSSDITELKSYEAELELQAAAMEASMDGIAVLEDGEYVYMNEAHADVFGYEVQDLLGRNWRYLYDDEEVERIETDVFEVLDDEGEWRGEAVGRCSDGSTVDQEITLSVVEDGTLICTNRDVSRRKAREAEIRELKERLDLAVEGGEIGIWDWNVETGEVVFNDQWAEMLGHSLEEIEPHVDAWERRVHPEDLPAVEERLDAHIAGDTALYDTEHRMQAKDGDWVWVRDVGRVVEWNESGEPERAVGIHLDITKRKHLESSLRQNAESLRRLYEVTADTESAFEVKLDRVLELACEHLDIEVGFMTRIADGTQRVVHARGDHEDLQAGATAPLSEAYCRKTIEQEDLMAVADSLEEGWADDPAYERFGLGCYLGGKLEVDGSVVGTLCWGSDQARERSFTEAEKTFVELVVQWVTYELEQQQTEERLRRLQSVTSDLSREQSIEGIGTTAVEAAADVLGLEVTGLWSYDEQREVLSPVAQSDGAADVIDEMPEFERGEGLAWEVFESGELACYDDLSAVEDRYNEETPLTSEILLPLDDVGLLATGSTSPGQFSESDLDLFGILGSSVEAAMTRSDREAKLRMQNDRLDEFASVVAHDLRNPLTVAMGMVETTTETGDLAYLDDAVSSLERIQRLIEDLLTLARGETEVTDPSRIDLGVVATEAWGYVDTETASVQIDRSLPVVAADESRVTQLFENLFRNAIEHNDESIEIAVESDESGFAVEDDGAGIPEEKRETVFEQGYTSNEAGTGFGLSIVEDIVTAHGWSVHLEDGREGGARFVFGTAD